MKAWGRLAGLGLATCFPLAASAQEHALDPRLQNATPVAGVTVVAHRPTMVDGITVSLCTAARASPDPDARPPVIIATSPAQGSVSPVGWVPLSLTFDQPVSNCSFAYSPDSPFSFPLLSGRSPVIREGHTLVVMIYLKPNQSYGLKLNDAEHPFFIGRSGVAAAPFELRFSTAP